MVKRKISGHGQKGGEVQPGNPVFPEFEEIKNIEEDKQFRHIRHRHMEPPPSSEGEGEEIKNQRPLESDPFRAGPLAGPVEPYDRRHQAE